MKKVLMIIIILALLIIGGYFWFTQKTIAPTTGTTTSQQTLPTAGPTENPKVKELRANGIVYGNTKGIYTIRYPKDYQLDIKDPLHIRIDKPGSMLVLETATLGKQTLELLVDSKIKTSTAYGAQTIIKPKEKLLINGYPAFTYTTRGLGEATNYVIQKDASSPNAVVITTSVQDPQNKNYQAEIDAIIATLLLLK